MAMDDLLHILADWNPWWETGRVSPELSGKPRVYTRDLMDLMPLREVKALIGVRRSGKSTFFYQVIDRLLTQAKAQARQILLVNFEDPAIACFSLDEIFSAYRTHVLPQGEVFLFLDEIQQKQAWEKWVRKKYDLKQKIQFFVTGSSADLLAGEYSSLLTGRNITTTVYPLGFREILAFRGIAVPDPALVGEEKRLLVGNALVDYLKDGGFPETLDLQKDLRRRLLGQYFQDIVFKDIVGRHNCHPTKIIDLATYLMTNIASPASLRALRNTFGYGLNLIGEYLGHLESAFLLFFLPLYDPSLKKQIVNPRKVYAVDGGLRNASAFKFSQDLGRMMENAVYLELKRRNLEVYYWKDRQGREVDFLVRRDLKIDSAIQVCFDMQEEKTARREILALHGAMAEFSLKEGLVITMNQSGTLDQNGKTVAIVPLYQWLLSGP